MKTFRIFTICWALLLGLGCKKLVEIPQPVSTITSDKVYNNDASATAAIVGIYNNMMQSPGQYANGMLTLEAGLTSDDLVTVGGYYDPYNANNILSNDGVLFGSIWTPAYYNIYQANAAIEGLETSTGLTPATKNQLLGEAKFVRALVHFYLVNLFGDIPLVTQSNWSKINLLPRTPAADVYKQIVLDLKDAQGLLAKEYPASTGGEKIRPNYWAATALLARVYLYIGDWQNAYEQSSAVINSGSYALESDLNNVFLKNSSEAIFQMQPVNADPWAVPEADLFLPSRWVLPPNMLVTNQLMASFEAGDQRLVNWVHTAPDYFGNIYSCPYKYKIAVGSDGNITEYYMVLRLAEQYLIRAEAETNGATGGSAAAIADLNILRARAGLSGLSSSLDDTGVKSAVVQERRVELFAEWGHRWFDLKRTGQADAVLSALKPTYKPYAKLWPIPFAEIALDPNLKQNPGYQ